MFVLLLFSLARADQYCGAGYFLSSRICSPCSPGSYCTDGDAEGTVSACPVGTYQPLTGQTNFTACLTCSWFSYSIGAAASCSNCPSGSYTYAYTGSGACCRDGYYITPGSTTCTICLAGTSCPPRASSAINCAAGKYAPTDGYAYSCYDCPVSKYSLEGSASCTYNATSCPPGTYSRPPSACAMCAAGTFQPSRGESSCLNCTAETYSVAGSSSCNPACPSGSYVIPPASCQNCTAGTFQPSSGQQFCLNCSVGTYQPGTGQASCLSCAAGTYQPSTGQAYASSCLLCGAGKYQPSIGQGACLSCPSGTFNPNKGSKSMSSCARCPPGTYGPAEGQATCFRLCPAGTFSATEGATSIGTCLPCPPGSFCIEGAASPYPCAAGYYGASAGLTTSTCSAACSAPPGSGCPRGSISPGNSSTLCAPGFYCPGGAPAPVIPCSSPENCPTAGLSAEPACAWSVDTLAGSAAGDSEGQGGEALFKTPSGVTEDGFGTVYVADSDNNRVKAVTFSGLVSNLAGSVWGFQDGTGTSAFFKGPRGVTTYPGSGIVYVADGDNNRIRKLTPSGVTTTFVGSGSSTWADGQGTFASFFGANGLTVDSAGVVYVASDNDRILKVTPLGAMTTLAGTGSRGYSNGVGTSGASFNRPYGVAVDGLGNVFVGDSGNNRIRLILPNGTVSVFSGNGIGSWADGGGTFASFSSPFHLSFAANGNLFVADSANNRIRMITPLGAVATIAGGSTSSLQEGYGTASLFNTPFGVSVGSSGTLLIGDSRNNRLRRLACMPCPASYFCPSSTEQPKLCPLGHACALGSKSPKLCPAGTVASSQGAVACQKCSRGSYASLPGSIACTGQCPPGTYGNATGSTSASTGCRQCPAGTYNEDEGAGSVTGCSPCPPGTASPSTGATRISQCTPCSPGSYASLAGSTACTLSPPGSFCGPSASFPTQCPLGTYNSLPGATQVSQCSDCPAGKTTSSMGAAQDSQCLAIPFTCPIGKQPRTPTSNALSDCTPLVCPPPLRPSHFSSYSTDALAAPQSLACVGCPPGFLGAVPACTPCAGSALCPGLTSRALYNFSEGPVGGGTQTVAGARGLFGVMDSPSAPPLTPSSSSSTRELAQGPTPASPFATCPRFASVLALWGPSPSASSPSTGTSTIFFGLPLPTTSSQSLLAWMVIFSTLFSVALFLALSRTSASSATGALALPLRALVAVDFFSMSHLVDDNTSPIKEATPLGGVFSLMGLTTILTYAAYMVATWLQDNTLVQQSLATMGPQVWGRVASLPWAAPPAASSLGSLALRLTIDGNPGACAAPLSTATTGLAKGAFALKSTIDCGGSGISQHTLTCPGCQLTSDSSISLTFDYSCQSMLLEALGTSPAYPGPLALSALAAPPKPGALLSSVTWQLTPVLSVLWDNVTAANSAIGWDVADSKLTLAPFLTPPALNGSLSIIPTASPVTVTFALSLSSTYSSTLLTQRVPITQLLANIVGLSGLLAFFGMAFGSFEGYCARKKGGVGAHKRLPLSSSVSSGSSALGGSPMEASSELAVDNPLRVGSPALSQRETVYAEGTLAGELQALRNAMEARDAALWRKVEALEAAVGPLEAPRAAVAAVVWQRHSDASGDEWYTSSTGETAWELPSGAVLQPTFKA